VSRNLVSGTLLIIGAGFLIANTRMFLDYLKYRRLRSGALLTWPSPRPRNYLLTLLLGVTSAILVINKLVVARYPFGELMMFLYFGCLTPLTQRIGRGFYQDGIWADSAFIPYNEVGGISWRESENAVWLVVISRLRNLARKLAVPVEHYAGARRLLREKIGEHEIHFSGTGLDLGVRDERDEA
jgi:hypothetical protein